MTSELIAYPSSPSLSSPTEENHNYKENIKSNGIINNINLNMESKTENDCRSIGDKTQSPEAKSRNLNNNSSNSNSLRNSSVNGTSTTTNINNNNYAAPHTPIASAKRPRNPSRSSLSSSPAPLKTTSTSLNDSIQYSSLSSTATSAMTPNRFTSIPEGTLSPMHPARPMQSHSPRDENTKGDNYLNGDDNLDSLNANNSTWGALFSPVLNFLGQPQSQPSTDPGIMGAQNDVEKANGETNARLQLNENEDEHGQTSLKLDDIIYDEDGDVSMDYYPDSTQANSNLKTNNQNDNEQQQDSAAATPQTSVVEESSVSEEDGEKNIHLHNEENENDQNDDEDDSSDIEEEEEFNPYLFIKRLPIYSTVVAPFERKIHLPPKDSRDPRQTLVLDLDETLVHCTVEADTPNVDMVFPVVFHGMEYQVHVKKRPFLKEFLERVYKEFEVVVFTASQRVYADELLNRIDPGKCSTLFIKKNYCNKFNVFAYIFYIKYCTTENKYIKHRMFRESCLPVEGNYLKDLNVLGRDLSAAVLVDNSPHAFGYQIDNGIPIESWFDDPHDTELLKLEQFLRTLKGAEDVRPLVRAKFQTFRLIDDA